jgi:hypothetical protein
MKNGWKILLVVLILIVLVAAVYFTIFFYYKCDNNDMACFKEHQRKCVKTKFINDKEDATWSFRIIGKADGNCNIEATILSIKEGSLDKEKLVGKSMICSVQLGLETSPESDLSNCHGILKEGIQEIMIKNAHAYIIQNIGSIGEELNKVV